MIKALPIGMVTLATTLSVPQASFADQGEDVELPVVGQADAESGTAFEGSTVEIHPPVTSEDGGYVNVAWTVNAEGGRYNSSVFAKNDVFRYYRGGGVSGVTLTDEASRVRYHPLQDSEQQCVCAATHRPRNYKDVVYDGSSATFWNSYIVADDVTAVTVKVPGFDPVEDVPIE
ncbi:hypothetical protein HNR23_000680 [Nocardiopsis mwathae]|uniref:Uncharacterized protein n=1 Tax=Nocardiopsis mwathae TaxID=1472723 RepID=A0A7W9YEC3_9ACTN|nr:hypothetical protein [Nocardiopsis mwathae]MBB6170620.1 hypothetical protein [Nocardiopsis mwathae]